MTARSMWLRVALVAASDAFAIWLAAERAWFGCVLFAVLAGLGAVATLMEIKG